MMTTEFVDCNRLAPGVLLDVETKNRHYLIECLGGDNIRISGHPDYCPTPTEGHLQGSTDKSGVVEAGLIERGKHLKFFVDAHRPVTTSRVLRVRIQRSATMPPDLSASIH